MENLGNYSIAEDPRKSTSTTQVPNFQGGKFTGHLSITSPLQKQCWGYVTFWCGSGSNSGFGSFFSDFKDAKNNFFSSYNLTAGTFSSVLKI
jgi:hypothetical protein